MLPRTQATLDTLRKENWFRNVGIRDTTAVDVIGSWKEAVALCTSAEWEDLCQEAVNQYSARLIEKSPAEYERWNAVVLDVKPAAVALVRSKTLSVVTLNDLPKGFTDTAEWDILHLCVESEFADIYPPGFYAAQAHWYLKGHFPCGYRGVFPNGRRVIY